MKNVNDINTINIFDKENDKHKFINYKNIINKFYSLSFTCCHIC